MPRKLLVGLALLAQIALAAVPVFAAVAPGDAQDWFAQKFAAKKAWVDQAVKNG